ncbi:MAG TPA: anti-sigma factor [Tepidisphaeraceae bacterium]|nr:anti-sigma factor [Tepidisphaeraceae bacterium]
MKCSDARELLDAYADDELDLLTSRRIDEHVEQCARCRLAMDHVRAIKVVVSHPSHYHRAPSQLRARVLALMHQPAGLPRSPKAIGFRWLYPGLAAAALIVLAVGLMVAVEHRDENRLVAEVLTAHLRSLQPNHLLDVVSTNQHTVKPWFDTHVDFSPPVPQLSPQFVLEGGRLDYVQNRPVAALVYRRGGHLINLFIWPGENGQGVTSDRGFNIIHWTANGMTFWAISDMSAPDLGDFVDRARAAGAGPAHR